MLRKNVLYIVVAIIGVLLLADIFLTRHNNNIIQDNKELQERIGRIRTYYDEVGKLTIHSLDIGLRGYFIVNDPKLAVPFNNAFFLRDSLLANVEQPLRELNYDFSTYNVFKDSLDAYFTYCQYMKDLIDKGDEETFRRVFRRDRGGPLWEAYIRCEQSINEFVEATNAEAQKKYEAAMSQNQVLQILLFVICVPTLLYTAVYTTRTFRLVNLLRKAETERNRILMEKNSTLEQFGYITAHNLRAPVARILGLGNLIGISESTEERESIIGKMLASTRDLDQVIRDVNLILDIRRNSGALVPVDLQGSVHRILSLVEKERMEKGVNIKTNIGKDLFVLAIPAYIDSILYNLVSNAIKYREASRVAEVEVSALETRGEIGIRVSDNGMGMDLNTVRKDLFGLYKRFHPHIEGRGIGLYLVNTQVEAVGGRLEVQSEPGKGTTFLIYLRTPDNHVSVSEGDDES